MAIASLIISIISATAAIWLGYKNFKLEKINTKLTKQLSAPIPLLKPSIVGTSSKYKGPYIRITNYGPGNAHSIELLVYDGKKNAYYKLQGTDNIPGPDNFPSGDNFDKKDLSNVAHYSFEELLFNVQMKKFLIKYKTMTNIPINLKWEYIEVDHPDEIFSKQDDFKLVDSYINL